MDSQIPHLAQQSIRQFLRPAAAHKVGPVQLVVAADGAIIISDSPQPDRAAPMAAPIPAAAGAVLRRRRIIDDDDEVQPSPLLPRARSPTAPVLPAAGAALPRRRRRIDDNDDDDEVQPAQPLQMMPSDGSDPDEADQFEGEVTFPHYCEMCPE